MNLYNLLSKEITQNELLNYYNATIIYEVLPSSINGFVTNYKGINIIFVNNALSNSKKKKIILHELAHIELNQLCQYNNDLLFMKIDEYEDEVDEYIKVLINEIDEIN